jgi:hypothetical protein
MFDKLPFFRSTKKRWEDAQETAESVVRNSQSLRPPAGGSSITEAVIKARKPREDDDDIQFDVKVTAIPMKPGSVYKWKIRTEITLDGKMEHVDEQWSATETAGINTATTRATAWVRDRKRYLAGETTKTFKL